MPRKYNVLFLCTGNSARSIIGEAILNNRGGAKFKAYSAGSHPIGKINPNAIAQLELAKFPTKGLCSKSWDEFAKPGAPEMDFVITVCDSAAREVCPFWPGHPMTDHWSIPDPAAVRGTPAQIHAAFRETFAILDRKIAMFLRRTKLTTRGQRRRPKPKPTEN